MGGGADVPFPNEHFETALCTIGGFQMHVDAVRSEPEAHKTDDTQAELIATLTADEATRLWAVVVQLKPHLDD